MSTRVVVTLLVWLVSRIDKIQKDFPLFKKYKDKIFNYDQVCSPKPKGDLG